MSHTRRRFLVSEILAGMPIALISSANVRAQGMGQMPGMGGRNKRPPPRRLERLQRLMRRLARLPSIMTQYLK